jgi:hypothetical protein
MTFHDLFHPQQTAAVACAACSAVMRVQKVTPLIFAADIVEIVYECPRCGAVTRRHARETNTLRTSERPVGSAE